MKRPSPEFQRNRRIILEGEPLCHWCKKAKATSADHLIESDRGGDDTLDNLVPACHSCNSKRGATYVNRKTAQRIQARNAMPSSFPIPTVPVMNCLNCGDSFLPDVRNYAKGTAKFCSIECARKPRKPPKQQFSATYNCRICGEGQTLTFIPGRAPARERVTCSSPECKTEYNRIHARESYWKKIGKDYTTALRPSTWVVEALRDETFLKTQIVEPPTPCLLNLAKNQPKQTSSPAFEFALDESGEIAPRLVSPVAGTQTFGPEVVAWTRNHLGRELFPWQVTALEGQLAHDGSGNLVHRESLVSTARQNGKSTAFHGLIGWALTQWPVHRGEPVHVLSTAHKLDRATAVFTELAPILEAKFGAEVTWSYGRSQLRMPDGSTWVIKAATPQNAHGGTYTLVVCDEIWAISEEVIFDALRPSMIAVKNPLLSMWSTAGDEGSKAFMRLREQAINAIDQGRQTKLFYAEWSAEPGTAWDDRAQWHRANPALGHTLTFDALESAAETPDRAAFIRAHLNQWIASNKSWLLPGEWEACKVEVDTPTPEVLAVDSSLDEALYVGVYSARLPDSQLLVWTAFVVDSETKAWQEIQRRMADHPGLKLAITPGLDLHTPLPLQRRRLVVGYKELCTWVPLIRRSIAEGRIVHRGEQLLSEHVNRAVGIKIQSGGLTLSSQKSPGPIELARCMVFATALASKPGNAGKAAFAAG